MAASVLALVAACGQTSNVDPDATVVISGQALAADGAPLGERPVRLASEPGGGETAFAFLTLGLACTVEVCADAVRSGETDASGRYRIELKGKDTQTTFGNVRQQVISTAAAPRPSEVSGAAVSARFVVQTEQLGLPPLRLVDPALKLGSAPGRVGASWTTSAAAPYVLSFETDSVVPVWQTTGGGTSATVDGRVLEDTTGRAVLSGSSSDKAVGSDVDITWRSAGLGYASAAGVPMSRGVACTYGAGAAGRSLVQETCALSDGDLYLTEAPPSLCPEPPAGSTAAPTGCGPSTTVTLALPATPRAELVVVRGCVGTCAVDVSTDGQSFRRAGALTGAFGTVPVSGEGVQAVRVGLGPEGLREVSVWGPSSTEPALQPIAADGVERLRQPYETADDDAVPTAVIVLAAVLCGAGVLGLGYLLGRRRRS